MAVARYDCPLMLRLKQPAPRPDRDARKQRRKADPDRPPFSTFLDRDADRQKRDRKRNRTLAFSLALHVVAVGAILAYSFLNVDELFGPSVEVKIFTPAKLPAGVKPLPPSP